MENISIVIGLVCLVAIVGVCVYDFVKLGKEKQLEKVKEWLLLAVIEAEKQLGGGTGKLKLRFVYDMFIEKFKFLSMLVSFEAFGLMVDEALDKMKEMLETNKQIKVYVEGNNVK